MKIRFYFLIIFAGLFAFVLVDNLTLTTSLSETLTGKSDDLAFDFELPDSNLSRAIYLNLKAAIAIDNESRQVIYAYNADEVRPVASISKLLTAMVVLDDYHPDSVMTITNEDCYRSARSLFRKGIKVRVKDLLHAALLQSDNRAARALARYAAGDYERFAELMNAKARQLGLRDTKMREPTGLNEGNLSSAADCARLINAARLEYPEIARITSLKKYVFKPVNKKRSIKLINTNKMVFSKYRVLAGKTGYIIESDYCLTTILENSMGRTITIVVLGSPGPQTRFREARRLANHAFRKIEQLVSMEGQG